MTLTAGQIRPFVTTGLEDSDLQLLVNAVYATIDARVGAAGSRTELLNGGFRTVALARRAGSVSSVSETIGTTTTTLGDGDYRLRPDGYTLERLTTGPNPRWYWFGLVEVTSVSIDDTAIRDEVAIALLKSDLTYNPGLTSFTIGAYAEQYANNAAWNNAEERDAILARLDGPPSMMVVGGSTWSAW